MSACQRPGIAGRLLLTLSFLALPETGGCDHQGAAAVDGLDGSIELISQALATADADGDGVSDSTDNCPYLANHDQTNTNAIGPGDACEVSLVFTTGLLGQFIKFQSFKELIVGLAPLTLSAGTDLMRLSAPTPSGAQVNISLLTQLLGVRSGLELLPGSTDTVSGSETLRLALGGASALGGGKASDIYLRLNGTATVQVTLLSGASSVSSQTLTNQGTNWKHVSTGGTLFDAVELRVTSGKFSLQGGGEAAMFALAQAVLPCSSGFQRVGTSCVDIDECAGIGRVCDALTTCTNTVGSFACGACPSGYTGNGLSGCSDVNECTAGSATCSSLVSCSNTMGSYQCGACPTGYTGDGHTCTDVNECTLQTDSCDPLVTCTNTPGSYTCGSCPSGYTGGGSSGCLDVNECTGSNRVCDPLVTCSNTTGSFSCGACPTGYRGAGATSCVDIDECSEGSATCSPLVACGNTPGSYQCGVCPSGYSGDGHTCSDINECTAHTAQCDALATCVNTGGSYTCGGCPRGYTGDGHTCTDIDECQSHPCDARTSCVNSAGSYTCGGCPSGFSGDGYAGCVDVNECNAGTATCSALVTCGNTLGGYTCSACPAGYAGDGHTCSDVDECAANTAQCDSHVTCINTVGGYNCGSCPPGFVGDGHTCTDIDECQGHPCDSHTTCTNISGSYLCSACPTGYSGDGYAGCADIDECAVSNGGCAQTDACVNTPGSHSCATCAASTVGVPTSCGVGACAATGITSCVYGLVHDSCVAGGAVGSDTTCNGIDDNCNGQIDEGYVSTSTSCGVSACASTGTLSCVGGHATDSCKPGAAASSDTNCDGIDEDCDGQVDEDFVSTSSTCGVGGCARSGAVTCSLGQPRDSCVPSTPQSPDVCNGIDDNCNGQTDEDFASTATSCGVGACTRFGASSCTAGAPGNSCVPASSGGGSDLCNGVDDDCDGQVDEDFVSVQTTCGTGSCMAHGTQGCLNGAVVDSCAPTAGAACDDGNVCNGPDVCSAVGVCQPSSPGSTLCCDGAVLPDPLTLTPIDQTVATSFVAQVRPLYDGPYASQLVTAGAIDPAHVSVITGRVLDEAGNPLACVAVRASSAPQYGVTRTRADGRYSLAVNGGGPLTIRADLTGFITSRRTVQPIWNHFATTQDIRLLAYPAAQPVSAAATTITVVAGAPETDKDGTRRATLLFAPGTHATVAGDASPRASYGVRIKEFTNLTTVGRDGMPAPLPASSAFTYATSFALEGAEDQDVTFDRPIAMYVENFLGFPNGEPVPTGRYDRTAEQWVAENSGRVIRIVSVSADGHAALDIDATAGADDASALGVTDSELLVLGARYPVGQSLWRVAIQHFSDWDSNWGWGPPADAQPPHCEAPFNDDSPDWGPNTCAVGSLIDCDTANLREHIPITATPFELFYASGRQPGSAKRVLHVPVTGTDPLPASALKVSLTIGIAGLPPFTMDFDKSLGRTYTYSWDGKDSAGRFVQGSVPAYVTVSNWYPGGYLSTSRFGYKGNGNLISGSSDRQQFALSKYSQVNINGGPADYAGLGGWTLNDHHSYDPTTRSVFRGDGTSQGVSAAYTRLQNVVGGGAGAPVDGAQAAQVSLSLSQATMAFGKDGSTYFTTYSGVSQLLRKVDSQGVLTTIAGGGSRYYSYDRPSPGDQAALELYGMAIGPDGNLYVTQNDNCVLKVDLASHVVSTHACLQGLGHAHLAFANDGSLYALDSHYNPSRLLRLHSDGNWEVVVSGGYWVDLAVHPDGGVIIADSYNRSIVRVAEDGSVKTIAGGGSTYSVPFPDGTPVATAMLSPFAVTVGPDGLVYFADQPTNPVIYQVTSVGTLERVVGTGASAVAPEGTPAAQAPLASPYAIGFAPDGALHFAQINNGVIQRVAIPRELGTANQAVVASADGQELYTFDKDGRHLWTSDAYTGAKTRTFGYDVHGNLLSITDESTRVTTIERDGSGTALGFVAPNGQRTGLHIDATRMLVGLTKPNNDAYAFGYTADGGGLLVSMKDPKALAEGGPGYVFEYEGGKLKRDVAPTGAAQTLSASFGSTGSNVSRATALGRTTQYSTTLSNDTRTKKTIRPDSTTRVSRVRLDNAATFAGPDGQGYDAFTTNPDGSRTYVQTRPSSAFGMGASYQGRTLEVMPSGAMRTSTQTESTLMSSATSVAQQTWNAAVNGRATLTSYDGVTRTFTTTTAAGRTSKRSLDAAGRLSRMEPGGGVLPIDFGYDASGRLQSVVQGARAQGNTYVASGPSAGYLESTTDSLAETTRYGRDAVGRILTATSPDQNVTTFAWDGLGDLTSLTPPGRPAHAQAFDSLGEQLSYGPPALAAVPSPGTGFGYNLDRQLTSSSRPDGASIGVSYDASGKLDLVTTPRGTYNYDYYGTSSCTGCAPGKLSQLSSPGGVVQQFTYDGSLLKTSSWSGPLTGSIAYSYDSDFRVVSESVSGSAVSYGYDADGLVTCASPTTCAPAGSDALQIAWDPQAARVSTVTLGQITETRNYNAYGELATIQVSHGSTPLYMETLDGPGHPRDANGRIVTRSELTPSGTTEWTYSYDANGRLEQVVRDGELYEKLRYDPNGNRLERQTLSETVEATYDAQDRPLTHGPNVYTYTANGERSTKTDSRTGEVTRYTYDVRGNLLKVVLPSSDVIDYVIDGFDRRIGKKKNGVVQKQWLYRDGLRIAAELDGAGHVVSRFVYASRSNVPDFLVRQDGTYRIVSDHLGSTVLVANVSTGQVVQTIERDAWGNVLAASGSVATPFGFAGGLYDADTGLVRFGARDYDAETGRWTARDPMFFGGGDSNLYAYCGNDPINGIDPSGLDWMEDTADWLDDSGVDDFAAGLGDALTGIPFTDVSITASVRDGLDISDSVSTCSGAYLGGQVTGAALAVAIHARGYSTGHEFKIGKNWRVAPWGNRTGNPMGERPHYHRRGSPGSDGQTPPGQGIGRHRPWEGGF